MDASSVIEASWSFIFLYWLGSRGAMFIYGLVLSIDIVCIEVSIDEFFDLLVRDSIESLVLWSTEKLDLVSPISRIWSPSVTANGLIVPYFS